MLLFNFEYKAQFILLNHYALKTSFLLWSTFKCKIGVLNLNKSNKNRKQSGNNNKIIPLRGIFQHLLNNIYFIKYLLFIHSKCAIHSIFKNELINILYVHDINTPWFIFFTRSLKYFFINIKSKSPSTAYNNKNTIFNKTLDK